MKPGKKIRKRRKTMGLTQVQLAEKLHLSPQRICDLERDRKSPSVDTLERVANALKCKPGDLL